MKMICSKCGRQYDDSLPACPECGTVPEQPEAQEPQGLSAVETLRQLGLKLKKEISNLHLKLWQKLCCGLLLLSSLCWLIAVGTAGAWQLLLAASAFFAAFLISRREHWLTMLTAAVWSVMNAAEILRSFFRGGISVGEGVLVLLEIASAVLWWIAVLRPSLRDRMKPALLLLLEIFALLELVCCVVPYDGFGWVLNHCGYLFFRVSWFVWAVIEEADFLEALWESLRSSDVRQKLASGMEALQAKRKERSAVLTHEPAYSPVPQEQEPAARADLSELNAAISAVAGLQLLEDIPVPESAPASPENPVDNSESDALPEPEAQESGELQEEENWESENFEQELSEPEPLQFDATPGRLCPHCGGTLPEDAGACPHCGAEF